MLPLAYAPLAMAGWQTALSFAVHLGTREAASTKFQKERRARSGEA